MHYENLYEKKRKEAEERNRKVEMQILLANLQKLNSSELKALNLLIASRASVREFLKILKQIDEILSNEQGENESA